MFALVDGNCFYASCERVFRPELRDKAIVVLSNNDGCVVTRTPQAKALGIKMGVPYYQVKHLVDSGELITFSSNYELYADLSRRMMDSIATLVPAIEVYSIDECFADTSGLNELNSLGHQIRERVLQWVGIPTCVGIAPTKTLAKYCNHLAKRHQRHFGGVLVWSDLSQARQAKALASEPVGEIWGIGRRISKRLEGQGIHTALDFYNADTATLRQQFGVVIERTQRELHGTACDQLHFSEENKQHIIRSRSFGKCVSDIATLESAIAHHISSGAAKLRQQGTQAHTVGVFIHTNRFREQDAQYNGHRLITLPMASSDTIKLNSVAQALLKSIYRPGFGYKKCGIELGGVESAITSVQQDLWMHGDSIRSHKLMEAMDKTNGKFGKGSLRLGSELMSTGWHMNRDVLSPCFTTRFNDLLNVETK